MADIDPLGIINSETQIGPDGIPRRANEKVTRNYMLFGKYSSFSQTQKTFLIRNSYLFICEIFQILNDIDMLYATVCHKIEDN